jgi:hypothetical protein
MCGPQCSPAQDDKLLGEDEITDSQHFCFFECTPAAGAAAPETSQCVALSADEVTKVKSMDPDGNPVDPAFLYAQSVRSPSRTTYGSSANLLGMRAKLLKDAPGAAKNTAIIGKVSAKSQGKDASLEASRLREMEHQKQQDLNKVLKEASNGVTSEDSLLKAKMSAEGAAASAAEAVQSYDQGRKKLWKLALSAASKEVTDWRQTAQAKADGAMEAMSKADLERAELS